MFDEFEYPETDEEFRNYKNFKFQQVAFEAREVLVAAEKQLAELAILFEKSKDDPALFKRGVRRARKAGKKEQEAESLDSFRSSLEQRRRIHRRMNKLRSVCDEMNDILRHVQTRGSDA